VYTNFRQPSATLSPSCPLTTIIQFELGICREKASSSSIRVCPPNAQLAPELTDSDGERQVATSPSKDNKDIRVVLSLPASAVGHDLSITLSPRKTQSAQSKSEGPPPAWDLPVNSGASTNGDSNDDPFAQFKGGPPSSQPHTGARNVHARHAVSDTFKAMYPSDPDSDGWKEQKWYVVRRGLEVGIFYDYWLVVHGYHIHLAPF
jgi:hypothetical protein